MEWSKNREHKASGSDIPSCVVLGKSHALSEPVSISDEDNKDKGYLEDL